MGAIGHAAGTPESELDADVVTRSWTTDGESDDEGDAFVSGRVG